MKLDKKNNSKSLIDSMNELCGGCRHKPKFHGHCNICPERADEAMTAEKLKNGQKTVKKSSFFAVVFWKNNWDFVTLTDTTHTSFNSLDS